MSLLGLDKKGPPGVMSPEARKVHSTASTFFILNLICIFFACWIAGAIGAYQAYQAMEEAKLDNLESAESSLRSAKVWLSLNGAFLVLALLMLIIMTVAGGVR